MLKPEGMQGAPSMSATSKNRRNGGNEHSVNLLEKIVGGDSLNQAYKPPSSTPDFLNIAMSSDRAEAPNRL
jgi:hypothetical protein